MRKIAKKCEKSSQQGGGSKYRRDTRTLLKKGRSLSNRRIMGERVTSNLTRRGGRGSRALKRSAGLRETARGSWHRKAWENASKTFPKSSQNFSNPPKTLPKPCQILPKSVPNPSQTYPKSLQKASWSPFWTKALKKLHLERPQNGPRAPKSAQMGPQAVPTPSKMEPKTLPKGIFM